MCLPYDCCDVWARSMQVVFSRAGWHRKLEGSKVHTYEGHGSVDHVCLEQGRLGLPCQVWDHRILLPSPLMSQSLGIHLEVPDILLPDIRDLLNRGKSHIQENKGEFTVNLGYFKGVVMSLPNFRCFFHYALCGYALCALRYRRRVATAYLCECVPLSNPAVCSR